VEDSVMANYTYRSDAPAVLTEHDPRTSELSEFDPMFLPLGSYGAVSRFKPLRWKIADAERRRWHRYQARAWNRFDRIQVFTQHDADLVRTISPEVADRLRVNPFGIRPLREADPRLEEPETLMFVGMFLHPANVDAALWIANDIMPLLRRCRPGVRLMIVGGYAPDSVRKLQRDDITVTGYVPSVYPFLERASVVLVPVRRGGGMRMKVLEAMAMGKAVVTTSLGAAGLSANGEEPPLGIAEDSDTIAAATTALLASKESRHSLGHRARVFAIEHHGWPVFVQRLESTYAEIVGLASRSVPPQH
jgi:glycosyltransferase involved in cell wall biosynthesis